MCVTSGIDLKSFWNIVKRNDIRKTHFFNACNLIIYTRIYRWKEIYREGSDGVEKRNHSLIIFLHMPWNFLTKSEKDCASWLSHHGLQWEERMIPYSMLKRLITIVVIDVKENDDNKALIYVKRFLKRE